MASPMKTLHKFTCFTLLILGMGCGHTQSDRGPPDLVDYGGNWQPAKQERQSAKRELTPAESRAANEFLVGATQCLAALVRR